MSYPVRSIAGISRDMAAKLAKQGIRTTSKLLDATASLQERQRLAEKMAVDEQTVARWANMADRLRIKGVREPYAALLKDAGIDTVKDLKYRNPGRLAEMMAAANSKRRRVKTTEPTSVPGKHSNSTTSETSVPPETLPPSPPALAEHLLLLLVKRRRAEALLGDFAELFQKDYAAGGLRRARLNYWARALNSVGPLLWLAGKRLGIFAALAAAARKYLGS
jgi:hypothetical protein